MSFKSVEMQIAIPRTSEIAQTQNQWMQKPVYDQAALAAKMVQQKEREQRQSGKVDDSAGAAIRDDSQAGRDDLPRPSSSKRKFSDNAGEAAGTGRLSHPYKGKHIDLSL